MPRPPGSRRRRSPAPRASRPRPPSSATAAMPGSTCWPSRPRSRSPSRRCKAEVKAAAIEQERRKEVAALAAKLVERLAKGETIEALAKETGAKVEKTNAGDAQHLAPGPAPERRAAGLRVAQGRRHLGADGGRQGAHRPARRRHHPGARADARADRPPEGRARSRRCRATCSPSTSAGLQTRYGLTVNEAALKQALGTGARAARDRVSGRRPPGRTTR